MSNEISEVRYKPTDDDAKSVVSYTDVAHPKELLSVLQCLRSHEELCDVVLLVGNSRISAHRAVLAASSPYFRAMFTGKYVKMFEEFIALLFFLAQENIKGAMHRHSS